MRYGTIIEPPTYQKICKPEHFFKKYRGFGINKEELKEIEEQGIKTIRIIYIGENNHIYQASTRQYQEKAIEYDNNGEIQKYYQ